MMSFCCLQTTAHATANDKAAKKAAAAAPGGTRAALQAPAISVTEAPPVISTALADENGMDCTEAKAVAEAPASLGGDVSILLRNGLDLNLHSVAKLAAGNFGAVYSVQQSGMGLKKLALKVPTCGKGQFHLSNEAKILGFLTKKKAAWQGPVLVPRLAYKGGRLM